MHKDSLDPRYGMPWGGPELADYLKSMSDEDLSTIKLQLEEDLIAIKAKLSDAAITYHSTGKRSDSQWFKRATSARRTTAHRYGVVCAEQGRRRDARKAENVAMKKGSGGEGAPSGQVVWLSAFVLVAKHTLPEREYLYLRQLTDQVVKKQTAQSTPPLQPQQASVSGIIE